MTQVLDHLVNVAEAPFDYLRDWKAGTGKKVVGCAGLFVPEELIHAAGILPVVLPNGREPVTVGGSHVQTLFCDFVRPLTDITLKGKLDFLDGAVVHLCCVGIRVWADVLDWNAPQIGWVKRLWFPVDRKRPSSKSYLLEELREFKKSLEDFAGVDISSASLRESINIYNRQRLALQDLYELRRSRPGALSSKEMLSVAVSGMLMDRKEHTELVNDLIRELGNKDVPSNGKVPVVVAGSLCEAPPIEVLNMLEEAGMVVVDDDLYTGSRYYAMPVDLTTDPLESLADAYLDAKLPWPTGFYSKGDWGDHLVSLCRGSGARGVISILPRNCDPHGMMYPRVRQKLNAAGIADILIETRHELADLEQLKTRAQAFVEIVGGVAS